MALIIDPDDLSQGLETAVTDAVFTGSSGANTTITSASGTLPTYGTGDFFELRDHSTPGNNGLYIATGTPTDTNLPCTKVDGTNPADAASEAVRFFGDTNLSTNEYKSVMIDTSQKRLYLLEQGFLSTDGVSLQALYSFLKEEWKNDADLIQHTFPMISITPEQFEFIEGWEPRDVTSPAIQSKKLIRTAGWSEVTTTDILDRQYTGIVTLGTFEDSVNDLAYYQLGDDPTDTAAAIDFTFAGPVNEAILSYEDYGVPGNIVVSTNNTITKSGGVSFITAGFRVGGQVTILTAEDTGNNGTFVLTSVSADELVVFGTPLTNNADDDTMRLAADNRNAVTLFLRVRDSDPFGKTYASQDNNQIGFASVDNKAFRFPLSNTTDLNISAVDGDISTMEPWTEVRIRYLPATYNRFVDSQVTPRDYGIVIDVGTYSRENGVSNGTTLFTSANFVLGAGEALADYANGTLIIHEGTDQGQHTISGTPVDNAGVLEITLSSALSGTESNLSFTMQRQTPIVATRFEIYEKVQYQLRQAADIDETTGTTTGRTADELLVFIGPDLQAGSKFPFNPRGGGSGVIIEGFDANDTNNLFFFDNGGISRNYPFVAAGTINFNPNLTNDSDPEYWMFFEYTTRTVVSDFAISGASGSNASIDSAGANLPTVAQNDYFRLTDMTNPENNGIWVVTDAAPTASQFDARKIDSAAVVNEGPASHPVDLDPIDSPQAIIVNDNSGTPIAGVIGAASIGFDFDYDNNAQGGRTPGTDAPIVIRAIGLETGVFAETFGTITRTVGLSFSVVAALERNYTNP